MTINGYEWGRLPSWWKVKGNNVGLYQVMRKMSGEQGGDILVDNPAIVCRCSDLSFFVCTLPNRGKKGHKGLS